MFFNTNYTCQSPEAIANREPEGRVFEFEESRTEQTGWMPAGKMVERLVRAGERLADWKLAAFDYTQGEASNPENLARARKYLDITEIQEVHDEAMARLRDQAQAAKDSAGGAGEEAAGAESGVGEGSAEDVASDGGTEPDSAT